MRETSKNYWPLIVLIFIAALAALATCYSVRGGKIEWMHYFMGFFFCQFSMLKLFDIQGFANGFQMYDLVAKHFRFYALIYPLIELSLGLAYLGFIFPILTYLVTIIFMFIGSIGVIQSLQKGLDVHCSCMGTILKVPLSTVTLTEDLGMGAMALFMLLLHASEF